MPPMVRAAELALRLNPEVDVVSSDPAAGTITVREKKTGKEVTFNLEDIKAGKFSITDGRRDDEHRHRCLGRERRPDEGRHRRRDGGLRCRCAASAGWVPTYPGGRTEGLANIEAKGEKNGTFTLRTADTSRHRPGVLRDRSSRRPASTSRRRALTFNGAPSGTLTATADREAPAVDHRRRPGRRNPGPRDATTRSPEPPALSLFARQTSGSVVCASCGRLVGVKDERCLPLRQAQPFALGVRAAPAPPRRRLRLRPTAHRWLFDPLRRQRSCISPGAFQPKGLMQLFAPDTRDSLSPRGERSAAGVRARARLDTAQRLLAARRPAAHLLQHDVGAAARRTGGRALRRRSDDSHLDRSFDRRFRPELDCGRIPCRRFRFWARTPRSPSAPRRRSSGCSGRSSATAGAPASAPCTSRSGPGRW